MANDISSNPWYLDTASTTVPVYLYRIKMGPVIWADYTTSGDELLITDVNGKVLIKAIIGAELADQWAFPALGWVNGLILNTMTHGQVTIAIGAGK
jgi:hypothetical protein